jgi:predicted RND superfamily exporter protein
MQFSRLSRLTAVNAARHRMVWAWVLLLLFAAATLGTSRLQLDLSFRPLFLSGDQHTAATREFESVFGQSSGAWILAVAENKGLAAADFLRNVTIMSEAVRDIPHVVEVSSLTTALVPVWNRDGLTFASPISEELLEAGEYEQFSARWESLLDGSPYVSRLVSADGSRLLIGGRLDLGLDELGARRAVVEEFKTEIESRAAPEIELYFTGVSVVELAYEEQILRDQLVATGLTLSIIILLLYWAFGRFSAVIICVVPVALAIPATLGMMGWLGHPVSIINTAIPAVILVVGVGDAVHMLTSYLESRGSGHSRRSAILTMLALTGAACFFTTLTTMGGFLALLAADLNSVGSFGLSAAIGILFAWLANRLLLPGLLRHLAAGTKLEPGLANAFASKLVDTCIGLALKRPRRVIVAALACAACCIAVIPFLQVDQYFNRELPPSHAVSIAQQTLESDFEGFLGPEISVQRVDGAPLMDDLSFQKLEEFVTVISAFPEVNSVRSLIDLLPDQHTAADRSAAIRQLHEDKRFSHQLRELINGDQDRLAVIVRVGDIGTDRASRLEESLTGLAKQVWGSDYRVEIVGQWWLAQQGMQLLLDDMLISFFTAMVIVLPIMFLVLRSRRLFVAAAAANLLPLLIPLAFMAATGTVLRIGTVVVLAVIIGIAVDNTFHLVMRLRSREASGPGESEGGSRSLEGTARAVVFTSFILAAGFLSMTTNQLLAIRDMGLVASVAILSTMFADLLVLPAVFAVLEKSADKQPTATEVGAL